MSYYGRLIHSLTMVSTPRDGALDDYGQPAAGVTTETAVKGLVQPRSAREMASTADAGAEIGDHVIFLPLMDLSGAVAFDFDGDRYHVKGVRRYAFGRSPHLEVDAERIGAVGVEDGS